MIPGSESGRTVVAVHRNPFDPAVCDLATIDCARPLSEIVAAAGLDPRREPVLAEVDGRFVLQREWASRDVAPGSHVHLRRLPTGGGGGGGSSGGGGKQVMAAVLTIAVTIAAFAIAGPAATFLTGATSGFLFTATSAAITAGLAIGGSLLVNSIIPPQPASLGNFSNARGVLPSASPTYSLQARGNTARLDQPIPVVYGRHILFPDFAATPYWEYADNEQYLYQLLVIGQGHHTVESIKIGTADISSFAEITTEIVEPGDDVTLFDVNVYSAPEVTGQSAKASNEVTGGVAPYVGPFPCAPSDAIATDVGIDVIMSRGLFGSDSSGSLLSKSVTWTVEAREIDSNGLPLGSWTTLASETYSAATTTPQRLSYKYALPSDGRYEVRLKRTDTKDTSFRSGHDLVWGGLRGYLEAVQSFGDVTLLAVKARATDNLSSQTSRQINVVVSRKLPVWDGASWSEPVETTSIVWVAADILRSATYGGGLADGRIDLAGLLALDAEWADRGDSFNAVFDQPSTVWEALGRVLRAGRAKSGCPK